MTVFNIFIQLFYFVEFHLVLGDDDQDEDFTASGELSGRIEIINSKTPENHSYWKKNIRHSTGSDRKRKLIELQGQKFDDEGKIFKKVFTL